MHRMISFNYRFSRISSRLSFISYKSRQAKW